MTIELNQYSTASNARRAAKAARLSEFDVYKAADGGYKIRTAALKAAEKFSAAVKAAKTPKAIPASKATKAVKRRVEILNRGARLLGKRAAVLAAAQAGKLPPPPDFSAPTHTRYRDALNLLVGMAKAGDIKALTAMVIKPYSSSPKALEKYRNLAVIALKARATDSKGA